MNKSLTPRQIYDILMAIVGPVDPVADSAIDHDRLENLHMLEDVADIINDTLLDIASSTSPYGSVRTARDEAANWVKFWHDEFYEQVIKEDGEEV